MFNQCLLLFLLGLSALVIFAMAVILHLFLAPLNRLMSVSQRIAKGEFPIAIMHKSRLGVGKLEASVEKMSYALAEGFRQLSEERGQILAIISNMAEGILASDRVGKIIWVNPAAESMFGVTEPEIIGRSVREGIKNNEIADLMEEIIRSSQVKKIEVSLIIPSEKELQVHASPIITEKGEMIGAVCLLYDITELRRLESYRSEFFANVSHELKTPLTAIRGAVETLLNGAVNDKEHNMGFLGKIEKHTANLSSLIDDILEISRLEAKKEIGEFVSVDLASAMSRGMETISEKAARRGIKISCECGREFVVLGLEEHIYRAIINLLDNAVKYTPAGGSISVKCRQKDGEVELSVTDTGIGIAAEHLPRIFERFYRVDKGRSRDLGGTGLGLAIVKHVMNIHNGGVTVESEPGKGTKFTLIFPVQ